MEGFVSFKRVSFLKSDYNPNKSGKRLLCFTRSHITKRNIQSAATVRGNAQGTTPKQILKHTNSYVNRRQGLNRFEVDADFRIPSGTTTTRSPFFPTAYVHRTNTKFENPNGNVPRQTCPRLTCKRITLSQRLIVSRKEYKYLLGG